MSYRNHKVAFAGGIQELSLEEVGFVGGGESSSYSLTGQGPQLSSPSAQSVSNSANAVSVAAAGVALRSSGRTRAAAEVVAVAAAAVAAIADFFG